MNSSTTVATEQWLKARKSLLKKEKEFTKARDRLTEARMALPRVKVRDEYVLTGVDGERSFKDLFGGKSQLIVQHFMFGVDWQAGCASCSFWADGYDGIVEHLGARDIAMIVVSSAPLDSLEAYRKRMGWSFQWFSCAGSSFNHDFGVSFSQAELNADSHPNYNFSTSRFDGTEAPGLSVFAKDADETIYHTYSTYGRGLDMLNPAYQLMDLVPKGRDESELPHTMDWLRRRDEY